jgi:glycolate oxidase FAD binding subunit
MHELTSILPAEHLRADNQITHASPGTEEELAHVLHACTQDRLIVTPTGGETKLSWGNSVPADVHLNLRRITGVREHIWQDMTCTVATGTTWADMQTALAQHKQRVALDPLFPNSATVGGIVATNDSGALRARYGSLRDLVLGAKIVLADGTLARGGGKVVKNVAGYDIPKLMTGSFGTLAVITEVTFRLHGLPEKTSSWAVHSEHIAPLAELMQKVVQTELSIEAMQMRTTGTGYAVDLRLAAIPEIVHQNEHQLAELASRCALTATDETVWLTREQLFSSPQATVIKITALPSALMPIIAGLALLTSQKILTASCVLDPVGIITASLEGPPEVIAQTIEDIRPRLRSTGGMVVILQNGSLNSDIDRWGVPPSAIEVMRSIKQEFDPTRTLNPGKFVGGI